MTVRGRLPTPEPGAPRKDRGTCSGTGSPSVTDPDCVAFLQWALPRMRLRWPGFRKVRGQVRKRLSRRLRELRLDGLDDYRTFLEAHPDEWGALDALCRITMSRFYRDRAVFDALRDPVLPELGRAALARGDAAIRAWSAGCASGEEPYTLSLAWALDAVRRAPDVELDIVATEVDARLLERARIGCYPRGSLKELPPEWVDAAFDHAGHTLCIGPAFRHRVELVRQDLREKMPAGPFDLVLCRNLVFTYFEPSLQDAVLGRILQRLSPGGLLVLGAHETLPPRDRPLLRPYGELPILQVGSRRGSPPRSDPGRRGPRSTGPPIRGG